MKFRKIYILVFVFLAAALSVKTVFIGQESCMNLSRMKNRNDSLKNKLVELEMKRILMRYNLQRLEKDTLYWERVFRLSGMGRKGEAFFLIRNDSLILLYDLLEKTEDVSP
ncbi:hypothetical protein JW890_06115 [candidate division WOR-3 bacterium]|nr:hypothetical protein [candidate division WOR-3 bacterium]